MADTLNTDNGIETMDTAPVPEAVPTPLPGTSVEELLGPRSVEEVLGAQPGQKAPTATVAPSKAFLERMNRTTALERIFKATKEAAVEGWGSDPVGLDPENYQLMRDLGIYNQPGKMNVIRGFNEALINPITILSDVIFKGSNAAIKGGAKLTGETVTEITGDETTGNRAEREIETLTRFLIDTAGGPEAVFMKPTLGATGKLTDVNIGPLPKVDDFAKTAKDIGAPELEPVFKQLYEEHGVLPKEVLIDAQTDVTISQDLLAGTKPGAYTGSKEITVSPEFQAILDERGGGGKEPPIDVTPTAIEGPKKSPAQASFEDAQAKILSKIDVGTHDKKRPWTFDRLYYNFMDDLNPVKVATRDALKRLGQKKLPTADDPYSLFRLTRGTFGKADQFLIHGTYDFNSYANTGKSLKAILSPVEKELDGLRAYIASKRALELNAYQIETGFDIEAAQIVVAKGKRFEKVQNELVDYQNELARYLKDSGVLSDKAYNAMLEAHKEYVPFFRLMEDKPLAEKLRGVGRKLGSKNPIKSIEGSDKTIVDPLESVIKNTYAYIALAEKNAAGVKLVDILKQENSYITELLPYDIAPGKTKPAGPMIEGAETPTAISGPTVENGVTKYFSDKGEVRAPGSDVEIIEPEVIQPIKGPAKEYIDAEWETVIPDRDLRVVVTTAAQQEAGDVIHIFRNGKRETYRVNDPDLLAAWRGLDQQSANLLFKVLSVPASTLRAGAVLSPEFLTRNLIRDFFSAVVNTGGSIFSPIDTALGFKSLVTKDTSYQNWLKGGGANSALVSMDRRYLQENLLKLGAETGLLEKSWNVVTTPLRLLRVISELMENSTRLGEFRKIARKSTKKADIQNAAMASREITIDFARVGVQIRAVNQISAFLNATLQSPDRLVRAFKERPYSTSIKIAGGVMLPSALLYWKNRDDPRYQQLPDWQRDLFWIVMTDDWQPASPNETYPSYLTRVVDGKRQVNKGTIYRIPKPFETGVIFGSGFERSLEALFNANPEAYKGWSTSVYEMVVPNLVPTGVIPSLEQFSNRSYLTGDPLISEYNEQKLPEYQYNPYTTETAKAVGKLIGAFPGMDKAREGHTAVAGVAKAITTPALLENYLRGWTGGLGMYVLYATDTGLRKAGVVPDPVKPADTLADIPFVKAFVIRYPSASAVPIREFYKRNEKNAQVMATFRILAEEGDVVAAQAVIDNYGVRATMDQAVQTMAGLSQAVRNIYKNPKITAEEKRQLIDTLYFNMITISETSNKMMDEVEKKLEQYKK